MSHNEQALMEGPGGPVWPTPGPSAPAWGGAENPSMCRTCRPVGHCPPSHLSCKMGLMAPGAGVRIEWERHTGACRVPGAPSALAAVLRSQEPSTRWPRGLRKDREPKRSHKGVYSRWDTGVQWEESEMTAAAREKVGGLSRGCSRPPGEGESPCSPVQVSRA